MTDEQFKDVMEKLESIDDNTRIIELLEKLIELKRI